MTVTVRDGGYRYLPGSRFAAHGVAAEPGMCIDRVVFDRPQPLDQGFALILSYLDGQERPPAALCGIELRMPGRLPFAEFRSFNDRYLALLADADVLIGEQSPFCRTNVAPRKTNIGEPSIGAFSFTYQREPGGQDFLLSGAAEVPPDVPFPGGVVRRGETSADAMAEKARVVAELVNAHVASLGHRWTEDATVHVYSQHDVAFTTMREALASVGVVPLEGLIWHDTDPPTEEIEIEIDVRRYSGERAYRVVP